MKNVISSISDAFLKEAMSSPRMLEDLAAMERYMAEGYDGRTFVELIQNSDDAKSERISIVECEGALVVANDGRPFDQSDVIAICRSGASGKQRGQSIGYRGVGFKSATSISTEIIIHSADVYFTFSKSICAKKLNMNESKVPTVRIPFLADRSSISNCVNEEIEKQKAKGFTTFFIFQKANLRKAEEELSELSVDWLLFLRNIRLAKADCGDVSKTIKLQRRSLNSGLEVLSEESGAKWLVRSESDASLAFSYDCGISACPNDAAVFHCFLPTLDKTGFSFKANADFSTDPSRKHIISDSASESSMERIAGLYCNLVLETAAKNPSETLPLISLLGTHTTLNQLVSQFERTLFDALRERDWVPIVGSDVLKAPNKVSFLPKWLTHQEKSLISGLIASRCGCLIAPDYFEAIEKGENTLRKMGSTDVPISTIASLLGDEDTVKRIPKKLSGKIFAFQCKMTGCDCGSLDSLLVATNDGYILCSEARGRGVVHRDFFAGVKEALSAEAFNDLKEAYPIFDESKSGSTTLQSLNSATESKQQSSLIKKWKTPVQNCTVIEESTGAKVSKPKSGQSGYDLVSTDPQGNETYISVKSIDRLDAPFSLSEVEYEFASKNDARYKVYLFATEENLAKYKCVVNPISTLAFRREAKEWAWCCDGYATGLKAASSPNPIPFDRPINPFDVDYDSLDGYEFEAFCASLLAKNGFEDIDITKASGDQGLDIIAYRDNVKYGIQCKCYSSDVGNGAVQEAYSGRIHYGCHLAVVMTNRGFTPAAIELSGTNGVVLWGRSMLDKFIDRAAR